MHAPLGAGGPRIAVTARARTSAVAAMNPKKSRTPPCLRRRRRRATGGLVTSARAARAPEGGGGATQLAEADLVPTRMSLRSLIEERENPASPSSSSSDWNPPCSSRYASKRRDWLTDIAIDLSSSKPASLRRSNAELPIGSRSGAMARERGRL